MRSARAGIIRLMICLILATTLAVTATNIFFLHREETTDADQLLLLLCETGQRNLNYYFSGVQRSVSEMASLIEQDLAEGGSEDLAGHVGRIRELFARFAARTGGVLTYYYRIDPAVSEKVRGFWYTNLDGKGFTEHEPTDISRYNTEDSSVLPWFTVPKQTRKSVWLPPYVTENLNVRVISYNVPILDRDRFIGVAGIEINYETMAEQVSSIRLYTGGLAFLADESWELYYHPRIDVTALTRGTRPATPDGLREGGTFLRYTFEGVEKKAVWLPLVNGMRLVVCVPVAETRGEARQLSRTILLAGAGAFLLLSLGAVLCARRIAGSLAPLFGRADSGEGEEAARKPGEVDGATPFARKPEFTPDQINDQIADLNQRAKVDALTAVQNKGAFTAAIGELQKELESRDGGMQFAVCTFDCNNLKQINDSFGHDMGDENLKATCRLICRVFHHSPVFRTGGDEFAVILRGTDYENRQDRVALFEEERLRVCRDAKHPWEEIHVAMGLAEYDPAADHLVINTVHRADALMYADKRHQKDEG